MLALSLGSLAKSEPQTEPQASPSAEALKLGHQALKLYQAARFREARDLFKQAESEAHSPVFVLYIARCERELGNLGRASEHFEQVASENLKTDAPEPWARAKEAARSESKALSERFASLNVQVSGDAVAPFTLSDGVREYAFYGSGWRLKLPPGKHTLELSDARGQRARRTLTLTEGQSARVVFELGRETPEAAQRGADTRKAQRTTPPAPFVEPNDPPWGAITALSLGGGALAFGSVAGILALTARNEFIDDCRGNRCLARDQASGDRARRWANLATAGFIVGGVSAAAGVTLLLYQPKPSQASVALRLYPSGLSLSGPLPE